MALPSGLQTVTVTFGPYLAPDGTPAAGTVTFQPHARRAHTASGTVLSDGQVTVTLDSSGAGQATLPASDAADTNPTSVRYTVFWRLAGMPERNPEPIFLPAASPTVYLDRLIPATDSGGPVAVPVLPALPGTDAEREQYVPARLADAALRSQFRQPSLRRRDLTGYKGLPGALATPPTVTLGVGGTTTTAITGGVKVWADRQDAFAYNVPTPLLAYGTTFPDSNYFVPLAGAQGNNTTASKVTPPLRVSFYHYGQRFEVVTKNTLGYQMYVDGNTSAAVSVTHSTDQYVDLFDFGSVGYRRIDIDFSSTTARFGGLFIEPTATVTAARSRLPRVCVVSDSFGEGTGAANSWSSWVYTLAALGGWAPWTSSWGGTGYLNPNSGAGRVKIRDRLTADVLNGSPDVIIWAAGYNDYVGTFTAAATGAEALACYQAAQAALPNVAQYVVAPWWHNGARTLPTLLLDMKDALKASAATVGAPFLDVLEQLVPLQGSGVSGTLAAGAAANATSVSLSARPGGTSGVASSGVGMTIEIGTGATRERRISTTYSGSGPFTVNLDGALSNAHSSGEPFRIVGPPLWTGTGRIGATAGNGNSDLLVSSDGVHPSPAGHDAIGRTVYELLAAALPA